MSRAAVVCRLQLRARSGFNATTGVQQGDLRRLSVRAVRAVEWERWVRRAQGASPDACPHGWVHAPDGVATEPSWTVRARSRLLYFVLCYLKSHYSR